MLTLVLPQEFVQKLMEQLQTAGTREVGGIMLAEHASHNEFVVRDMTFHKAGTFATFIRRIEDALGQLKSFFRRTNREYTRFNYIGEWHSHPSFVPEPSFRDDETMFDIVVDRKVAANFVVLLVVKLDELGSLQHTLHTYLPDGTKSRGRLRLEVSNHGH